jgi:ferric-dicitrate binding protein FerR (iron transport regulator)
VINQPSNHPTSTDDQDRIAELLRLAGPGPEVPANSSQRVRLAVREEWLDTLRARTRRTNMNRGLWALAAAAVLAIVIGVGARSKVPSPPAAPPVEVATVNTVIGSAHLESGGQDRGNAPSAVRTMDTIRVGDILETDADGLAALQLASGQSLRINRSTRFWFESPSVIRLERGTVFFDSRVFDSNADGTDASDIQILTDLGVVYEIGTQFEVMRQDGDLRVRVREGAIDLERGKQRHRAEMGAQLLIEDGETLSRLEVPIYGPEWNWILALSPKFELEGSSLAEFLQWVSRETGRTMQMSARADEARSMSVILHGSIDELPPDEALEAVLPTCDLRHAVNGGTVLIDLDS